MRDSLKDIAHLIDEGKLYMRVLPPEIIPFYIYVKDGGHSILCVLSAHMEEAMTHGYSDYEVPVPALYVLEKGYTMHDNFIEIDAEYDSNFGLVVDEKYYEF